MNPRDPYQEALDNLDEGKIVKALDLLHWAGRSLDPLLYDEVWAEVHLHRGEMGKAAELAEKTLTAGRDTPRLHRIAAVAQWRLGLRVQARRHAEKTAEDDPWALYQRALIAFEDQSWAAAEAFAGRSVALRPEYTNAEGMRLYARAAGGERSAGVLLRKLWEESREPTILNWALMDAGRRKEWETADGLAHEARALGVQDLDTLKALLWHHAYRRSWDDVITIYDDAPEAIRDDLYVLHAVGCAFSAKGEYRESLPFLAHVFEAEPGKDEHWRAYGKALLLTRQFALFLRVITRSTKANEREAGGGESSRDFLRNTFRHRR